MTFAVISEISEALRLDLQSRRLSLILPTQAAIAEAKLQLNPFLVNLPVSQRDRLFFSFSCLFRQQPKRDCLWQRASLDRLVNH